MPLASKKKHSIFKAISDPTRREIFHILIMASVALSINQIADKFKMSRQAVTRHIHVLNKAGLVDIVPKGRERYCYADPKPLREIRDWVSYYEKFWDNKISALDKYLKKK
ncbi:DNA-binding transcriptional regulator, ArsR family [Reichenbachiella faecimaris]|uniref:DNA-binding transcriptional regulator, ArsR family n=1 Tax=Reichenbachiella faecimaris TaxID=692418 RepID=A0A1W2GI19_REIFA|nr:metalloregulator ArsR/SmtB family transcription factor [Reichenbachiella faecimaris]SMD36309.1 DNA-binding transcriptional regulator, ArsR family [Reichenbachiella faecimaris]